MAEGTFRPRRLLPIGPSLREYLAFIIPPMALDGFIFDLDGTLIDTNLAHIEAWRKTFERFGFRVAADRIFIEIGKGGDKVVPHLLGREVDEEHGDAMRRAQPEEFKKIAEARGLPVFPGAVELLREVKRRGLRTVLATSSNKSQLAIAEKGSGVDWRDEFDEVVTASDIERSKPSPDLVSAAAEKLGLSPAQCVMVGDTPYDAEAAKHAGVVCIGLTCGGHEASTLLHNGARVVFRDARELLARLDEALRVTSPTSVRLTREVLELLMREALAVARQGMEVGEAPIGAILADGRGQVVARGFNELNKRQDPTAHAEMVTFQKAAGRVSPGARDSILVSTLEPCVMCLGASMEAAVDTVVYGLRAPADSGTGRVRPPQSAESQMPRIVGGVLADEGRALFEQFLKRPGINPKQAQFVKQLLELTSA